MEDHIVQALQYAKELGFENMRVEKILGYGAYVCLLQNAERKQIVIKVNKEFQPYPSLPLYPKSRVVTEATMYSFIENIDKSYVPKVHGVDEKRGVLAIDQVSGGHIVFDDLLLAGYVPTTRFMETFVEFLRNKEKASVENVSVPKLFYTQATTKALRSLFVPTDYVPLIDKLFQDAEAGGKVINCSGLSPKNIFVSPTEDTFKLIDFEEAFIGDRVFDPAYFASHLLLYALATKNNHVLKKVKEFTEKAFTTLAFTEQDISRYARYVGLILLHRAEGFNLKGIPSNIKEFSSIGGRLLREEIGSEMFQ